VEACPSDNKSGQMSLLHSFYCWGQAGVVVISTLVFTWFGIGSWPVLACLWALLPLGNALVFLASPVPQLHPEGGALGVSALLRTPVFWVLALMMVCGGASEQAMSQWASAFAETGLGVSKTMGDLLGPCLFALMMGLSRVGYAAVSQHRSGALETIMAVCAGTCALGYLIASLCAGAAAPLLGCALVGFSVGLFWPGTFSVASARCPAGGTAMFALLALAGDLGCSGGPYLVGLVSAVNGDRLSAGLLAAVVLPVLLLAAILLCIAMGRKRKNTL
jgi:fucose permease